MVLPQGYSAWLAFMKNPGQKSKNKIEHLVLNWVKEGINGKENYGRMG